MTINKSGIKLGEVTGRNVSVEFTYTEKGKTYEGVLSIVMTNVGGLSVDDYEVIWADDIPKNYRSQTDDKKIYEAYLEST